MRAAVLLPLLAALFAVVLLPVSANAQAGSERDRADLARFEQYLAGMRKLSGRFIQFAPDGAVAEGRMWLSRPNRFRFEYDPPSKLLVVGDGSTAYMFDPELKQLDQAPLSRIPLALLVADDIKFGGRAKVERIDRSGGVTRITLIDNDNPKEGSLTLTFGEQPLALSGWAVTDARGLTTTVSLKALDPNPVLNDRLFRLEGMSDPNALRR